MVVEYTRYKIDEKRKVFLEQAYGKVAEVLASSKHCLRHELLNDVDNPDYYTLRIEWESEGGHLNGFRSTPEFKTFLGLVRPFVRDIEEICLYEVNSGCRTPARSPEGPDLLSIIVGE